MRSLRPPPGLSLWTLLCRAADWVMHTECVCVCVCGGGVLPADDDLGVGAAFRRCGEEDSEGFSKLTCLSLGDEAPPLADNEGACAVGGESLISPYRIPPAPPSDASWEMM
jgi:hypothetical protein